MSGFPGELSLVDSLVVGLVLSVGPVPDVSQGFSEAFFYTRSVEDAHFPRALEVKSGDCQLQALALLLETCLPVSFDFRWQKMRFDKFYLLPPGCPGNLLKK